MKRRIYEINYTKGENSSERIFKDKDIIYYKLYINPYKFHGICGQRCDTIYCDARFMDSYSGRELIESVFKPMLCSNHPDKEGFRLFNFDGGKLE